MIIDTNSTNEFPLRADVCVCGGGPAGITVARALASRGKSVLLVEGGGLEWSEDSQEIYAGENIGQNYYSLDSARLRFLGGSSNHWTGHCGTLDAFDFDFHDHHPMSGWPIQKADLDPYEQETRRILDLPSAASVVSKMPVQDDNFSAWQLEESPPTRFGEKYIGEFRSSDLITVLLNLDYIDVRLDETLRKVTTVVVARRDSDRTKFSIEADNFVMCMGGIENPRILLNATDQIATGIGNQKDNVGRYFQEHLDATVGYGALDKNIRSHFVAPSKAGIDEFQCLNFGLRIYTFDGKLPHNSYKKVERLDAFRRMFLCGAFGVDDPLYSIGLRDAKCQNATLWVSAEQSLNPDSRVLLGSKKDVHGKRLANLDWRLSDLDWHTMQQSIIRYGEYLIKNDLGRVRLEEWLMEKDFGWHVSGGYHHMCTTRMSASPAEGVVDRNCRVYGTENLYIGGSSVFATGGHINPTFTIIQLALRLAEHLA